MFDFTARKDSEAAEEVVKAFSTWVNGKGKGHDNKPFVETILQEHRTLQQLMFGTMLACIEGWANTDYYDLRNEFTVLKCREIMKMFPSGPRTPFI